MGSRGFSGATTKRSRFPSGSYSATIPNSTLETNQLPFGPRAIPLGVGRSAMKTSRWMRPASTRGEAGVPVSSRPQPPAASGPVGKSPEKRSTTPWRGEDTSRRPWSSRAIPVAAPMSVASLQKFVLKSPFG